MSFIKELAISIPLVIIVALIATHFVVVPTGSMVPSIKEGDMVLAEKVDVLGLFGEFNPENIQKGDIIIYDDLNSSNEENADSSHGDNEKVIHRVVAINESNGEKYFTLKGDANNETDDEAVQPSEIEGKVVTWNGNPIVIPEIGWLILWFNGQ